MNVFLKKKNLVKLLCPVFLIIFNFNALSETIRHKILPDKYLTGGIIDFSDIPAEEIDHIYAVLNYVLKAKWYVPLPKDKANGQKRHKLHNKFLSMEGYWELEENGEIISENTTYTFMGRTDIDGYQDVYEVFIKPNTDEWDMKVYYHPSIPSLGWIRTKLTVYQLPMAGTHTVSTKLVHDGKY